MDWRDIACIVFVCVTANHLGLVATAIGVFFKKRRTLPIISCPRCLTFWTTLAYGIATVPCASPQGLIAAVPVASPTGLIAAMPRLLAISFLCAYLAIWLELAEGIIDKLYDHIYGKIYPTTDTANPDAERP